MFPSLAVCSLAKLEDEVAQLLKRLATSRQEVDNLKVFVDNPSSDTYIADSSLAARVSGMASELSRERRFFRRTERKISAYRRELGDIRRLVENSDR